MLTRIVKMTFIPSRIDDFLENYHYNKNKIRNFKGCRLLNLYRDKDNPAVFFTYSHWNTEEDLRNYRNSVLFKSVWAKTKEMFSHSPEAWSVDKIDVNP